MLALPRGSVHAFEVDESLARQARENLEPFEGVSVTHGDATALPLPASDLIYVNAGVVAPPVSELGSKNLSLLPNSAVFGKPLPDTQIFSRQCSLLKDQIFLVLCSLT
jgi:precorrin-6B methylase 2